ncbi:endogenous retrovirus group K member 10 Gag polyprotein-like [Fukomys damarensis]|uniref:endogenous retrovirus group K member 10 Gag polyprotein-like n=1 Tax=Fukomys damarensis TaxID=885580 RepID=UPI0008FEC317|nr:endogenous retrovirus group K member 10 Gag polyprotein-like [Fukomys damarensis]
MNEKSVEHGKNKIKAKLVPEKVEFAASPGMEPSDLQGLFQPKSCNGWRPLCVNSQPFLSPLQQSLKQASINGEDLSDFLHLFPVFEGMDGQGNMVRTHNPVPFKQLKELKMAYAQYSPIAPFTQALLDSLSTDALPPFDWKQIAKACLSGGDYLLWKSEYTEQCQRIANLNRQQGELYAIYEMLAGEGPYAEVTQQLGFPPGVYAQVNTAAKNAWKKLPSSGRASEDLSKIRQGPDEPFQNFVDRLLQTASRVIGESEAGIVLVKQLVYENANSACQAALHPFRKKADLSDYVRLCADIGPSYTQGLAMAAALQGKTIKEVLFQQHRSPQKKGNNRNCFGCGQAGHLIKNCPQRKEGGLSSKQPGLCPRCKRGYHWANECKSKKDVMQQMGVYLYSPNQKVSNQMFDQGFLPNVGLGKEGQGIQSPVTPTAHPPRQGLGYFP